MDTSMSGRCPGPSRHGSVGDSRRHRVVTTPPSDEPVGGIAFVAELGADGEWDINLLAC